MMKRITEETVRETLEKLGSDFRLVNKQWGNGKSCGCVFTAMSVCKNSELDIEDMTGDEFDYDEIVKQLAAITDYDTLYAHGFIKGFDEVRCGGFPTDAFKATTENIELYDIGFKDGVSIRQVFIEGGSAQ